VYASFGSKRALLSAALDATVAGEDEDVPLVTRDWVNGLRELPDPASRVRALFAGLRPIYERTAPIERVLEEAAGTDPEIAQLARELGRRQREDTAVFLSLTVGDGVPFPGLTPTQDAEAIWALLGTTVYRKLVEECGWSPAQWENWAVSVTERLLTQSGEVNRSAPPPRSTE
jgi:AcrR family transcriptional regulator